MRSLPRRNHIHVPTVFVTLRIYLYEVTDYQVPQSDSEIRKRQIMLALLPSPFRPYNLTTSISITFWSGADVLSLCKQMRT